ALGASNLRDVLGPYRRPEDLARYAEGLRKAGLPERSARPWRQGNRIARVLFTTGEKGFCVSIHGSNAGRRWPRWLISGHMQCKKTCPLYPRKRTCALQLGMSALGQ